MRHIFPALLVLSLAACQQQGAGNDANASRRDAQAAEEGAGAPPLAADGTPQFRAGMWEVTSQEQGKEPKNVRHCAGDDGATQFKELVGRLEGGEGEKCEADRITGPNGLQIKSQCQQSGLTVENELTLSGTETSYEMAMSTYVVLPDGKRQGGSVTASGRWAGACPAGVRPGDKIGA